MARLRIRDPSNTYWIDICFSEWYLRNPGNTGWRRILPGNTLAVRSSGNLRWLQVNCNPYGEANLICDGSDPYDPENPLNPNLPGTVVVPPDGTGSGGGSGGSGGSGGGTGGPGSTGGTSGVYNPGNSGTQGGGGSYTPGYGIDGHNPDGTPTEDGKPVVIIDPSSPTGESIITLGPNGETIINTYDRTPETTDEHDGNHLDPHKCPFSMFGGSINICESYVTLGTVAGLAKMWVNVYAGDLVVEVYHGGVLILKTPVLGFKIHKLQFVYDPSQHGNDHNIFIRATSTDPASYWILSLPCPTNSPEDDAPGTPSNPAKCLAVMQPTWGQGVGIQETYHDMGNVPGFMTVEYQMFDQPDKMGIYYKGQRLGGTSGFVSGEGSFQVNYVPDGVVTDIVVRVEGQEQGTTYVYRMYCPGQDGTAADPRACGETTQGSGAGTVDMHYALGNVAGYVVIRYITFDIADKIEVYQGSTLVCQTDGFVSEESYIWFYYDPVNGTDILLRVIGSVPTTETTWAYLPQCPELAPVVSIQPLSGGQILPELNTGQQQFIAEVYLDKPALIPCSVDWAVIYSSNADASDVSMQTGTVNFDRGEDIKQITINTNTDIYQEADELFGVELLNPQHLTLGTATTSFTIQNDDVHAYVTISVVPAANTGDTITEPDSGSVQACADIVLSNITSMPVTVNYQFNYGTALASDVTLSSGQVTINPGESFQRVCCDVLGDTEVEPTETFTCTISNPTFGDINVASTTFYISDNDSTVIPCNNQIDEGTGVAGDNIHELGNTSGTVVINYNMFTQQPDRLDVYYENVMIATTGGSVLGTGNVQFAWNPQVGHSTQIRVVVTPDNLAGTRWEYQVFCPA